MHLPPDYKHLISVAELQFRLSIGVRGHCAASHGGSAFNYPHFSVGKHLIPAEQLELTLQQERVAAAAFEHSATYLLAVQVDSALQHSFPNGSHSQRSAVRAASKIARLIRNAYSHDPFHPVWLIPQGERSIKYRIPFIIQLNTVALHGHPVERMHYGGPLALLKLAAFAKHLVGGAHDG